MQVETDEKVSSSIGEKKKINYEEDKLKWCTSNAAAVTVVEAAKRITIVTLKHLSI